MELKGTKFPNCPYFSRTFSKVDELLIKNEYSSHNHLSEFVDELSVEDLILSLANALGISEENINRDLKRIVKQFEMNWIFNWRQLKMLSVEKLRRIDVPVMILNEIERAVAFYREQIELYGDIEVSSSVVNLASVLMMAEKYGESDVRNVRHSWGLLKETKGVTEFAEVFYNRFFERSPVGKRLFVSRSLQDQARTLVAMIDWIEANLENRDKLSRYVKRLGGRHALYGVTANDYYPFIEEIVQTFRIILGEELTEEVFSSWRVVMRYCAKQMLDGSMKYEKGVCFEALLGNEATSMDKSYLKLTLDRLYICEDNSYGNYKRVFVLGGLVGVVLLEDHCFELISDNPPFTIVLGAQSESAEKSLIKRFTWRIKAIRRLVMHEDSKESNSEDSDSVHTIAKRTNLALQLDNDDSSGDTLMVGHKEILQRTWNFVISDTEGDSAGEFFDTLYKRLIKLSPIAHDLFGDKPVLSHISTMAKMIGLIIRDPSEQSTKLIERVGAKHFIFGLTIEDMNIFAVCVCDALQSVLGDLVTQEVRDVWYDTISGLGRVMMKQGRKLQTEGLRYVMSSRNKKGSWDVSGAILTCTDLHIYKGSNFKNFKTTVHLREIFEADVEGNDFFEKPSEFCSVLRMQDLDKSIWFCFSSRIELRTFVNEIQWRIRASLMRKDGQPHDNSTLRKRKASYKKKKNKKSQS